MKKKTMMLAILLTIVFGIFNPINPKLFPVAKATYVEGAITQDTIWTLVDSPFVVSNNITVYPNATLTIEPGVQVRFGGLFNLTILGKLYANGTEKPITFTSNKEPPTAGDWDGIYFSGANTSTLISCSIAYAINGLFAENGNVDIKNSDIRFCRDNGINMANANVTIRNCLIAENSGNGVCITGNGLVTITESTVMANGNGVLLTGYEVLNVNITGNKISVNNNGILLDAATHSNIVILYNNISSNNVGFQVSSLTSFHIGNNSISYNTVGIFYELGDHTAHYNDIYGNEIGMDVASNATVDAEYNYWGDPSGPYHEMLNPDGRGNRVGGDGVNLDFIFFLSKPFSHINKLPTAGLMTDKVWVRPNDIVMFFDNSSDDGRIDKYLFVFGDGSNSSWTTLSCFGHKYAASGDYSASLMVMDDFGAVSSPVTIVIHVNDGLPLLHVNLALDSYSVQEGGQVAIVVHVTDGVLPVGNATVTMISVRGGVFQHQVGLTDPSGDFTTVFAAPDVTEIRNVRIVARASKEGYNDGSDYEYLEVSPYLSVEIVTPSVIKSEETASVTIYVKSNNQPIANASVTVSSTNGTLSAENGITDMNGAFAFDFTAPRTTTSAFDVTISATAKKSGYLDGSGLSLVTIEPKVLTVQIIAESITTISEGGLNLTVHVGYMEQEMTSIEGANVTITADGGNFSATTGLTGNSGNITFAYTAPAVNETTSIKILATATKDGYAQNQTQLQITVNPKTFIVEIITPATYSEEAVSVTVLVTCAEDDAPVADAIITISATSGTFPETVGVTDANGYCTFTFYAPKTATQLPVTITANVSKSGYASKSEEVEMTINPKAAAEGGWPWWLMLLIVIPIVVVVIVVVLIKLKIIVISFREEEQ